jgi:hypothetical protein
MPNNVDGTMPFKVESDIQMIASVSRDPQHGRGEGTVAAAACCQ